MTAIQRLMKLHRLMNAAGSEGTDTGGTGTGTGTGAEGSTDDGAGEGAKKEEAAPGTEGKKADDKPAGMSEPDAKLLKDMMKHKARAETLNAELAAAQAKLKDYDGVDATKARKLVADEQEAERKAAEARGEYDRLVKQMAERHTEETAALNGRMSSINSDNEVLRQQIADLTVGNAFGASSFVATEMTLTPNKARIIYGAHFEFKDGKIVGYDKPASASDRTVLVNAQAEPLSFDEALRKLVDADADRDHLLRTRAKPGAGSSTTAKGAKAAVLQAESQKASNLSPAEKIAAGLKLLAKG
jgi:hypothetical protein